MIRTANVVIGNSTLVIPGRMRHDKGMNETDKNICLAVMAALVLSYCMGSYHGKGAGYENGYQEGYAAAIQQR